MIDFKEKLKNYNHLKNKLSFLKADLENLKSCNIGIQSMTIGDKVQSSNISDPTSNFVIKNIEKEKKIEIEIEITKMQLNQIDNILNMLPECERKIIEYRYKNRYSWIEVCELVGYCQSQAINKMNKAIERINLFYDDIAI